MDRDPAARARRRPRLGLLPGLFLLAGAASAGSFQVTPMLGEVPAGASVHAVTLRNHGNESVTVQVDAFDWRQAGNRNVTEAANNLLVVPPIATIPPGGNQMVRFALRGASREREHAFRVHYREVPRQMGDGFFGVSTVIKLDVPLFFTPENPARQVTWRGDLVNSEGAVRVTADSTGNRFARFSRLTVLGPDGTRLAEDTGPKYVLAGATRSWDLELEAYAPAAGDVVLEVVSDGETVRHELSLR